MEFQEFGKHYSRMCVICGDCPFYNEVDEEFCCEQWILKHPKEAEQIVEQWAKEHPIITNADKFREVFGKPIGSYGAPCPSGLTIYETGTMSNLEWLEQEYIEPKGGK